MSLEDLLQAMMGGAGQQRPAGRASSDDRLADMLRGILGSDAGQQRPAGRASSDDRLVDMLQGILGGGAAPQQPSGGGGLMDIISAMLGGGAAGGQVTPIIEGVSGKTGLSQMIVQMILSFVMSKLLGGMSGGSAGLGGLLPGMGAERAYPPEQQAGQGLDLDSLLQQMGQDSSMVNELAQQTGLDAQTAQQGLQEVLGALGAQRRGQGSAPSQPKQGGLDDLLQNW